MRGRLSEIEQRGARLVVVGNGNPHFAKAFAEDHDLVGAVYTDPERALYRALGMKAGVLSTVAPAAVKNAARAFRAGFRQEKLQGSAFQQGGVLVVDGTGAIRYEYLSEVAGDHPPIDDILPALDEIESSSPKN